MTPFLRPLRTRLAGLYRSGEPSRDGAEQEEAAPSSHPRRNLRLALALLISLFTLIAPFAPAASALFETNVAADTAATTPPSIAPDPSLLACDPGPTPKAAGTRVFRFPGSNRDTVREIFPPASSLSWSVEGAPELTTIAGTLDTVLEFNAVRFPGRQGSFYGFVPGELYEEVYARDTATAAKAAQYLYGDAFLRSALEEFLAKQLTTVPPNAERGKVPYPGPGSLLGYLTIYGLGQKTTTVSDEEASLVQLAYLYYRIAGGPDWLRCAVDSQPLLQRMNTAMDRLMQARSDPNTGLIRRAFTTDWGDVRFQGGAIPTMADPISEYWTISIYDQAWNYLALQQLAEMNRAAGQTPDADRWEQLAARIRTNTNRLLWMPERGYYRLHLKITPLFQDFNEDNMIAIGNAVALYAGLPDAPQVKPLLDALERARVAVRTEKPGLSLYPSYPEGFFRHHLMYESGRYQNGGLWDWWGGVQMTAEFEAGFSALGWQHLRAVAKDWAKHPGDIAEWDVPATAKMEGSHYYAGAAGTVSEAVVRGAFGVELTRAGFQMRPRLGARNGQLQVTQPASGASLWLRQRLTDSSLLLQYSANHPQPGTLAVLLPPGVVVESASLDGQPLAIKTQRVGQDTYADAGTVPSGTHSVELHLTKAASEAAGAIAP